MTFSPKSFGRFRQYAHLLPTLALTLIAVSFWPKTLYCQESNSLKPSAANAVKRQSLKDRMIECVQNGSAAYNSGDYFKSVEQYSQALDLGNDAPSTAYNAACSAALSGQTDLAFGFLDIAIGLGWVDSRHLKNDSDLKTLQQDKRWSKIVEKTVATEKSIQTRWNSPAFRSAYSNNISDSEKAAGLAKLWSEIKYNFAHFDQVPGLDWDAVFVETLPKVLETQSTLEYYRQMKQMVAKLNDGHTNVYLPRQLAATECSPGIATKLVEGKVIVVEIYDRSLEALGLRTGMELTKVDGIDVKKHVGANVSQFVCASTKQDRKQREFGRELLRGPLEQSVVLTVKSVEGVESEIAAKRESKMQVQIRRYTQSPCKFKVLDENIGYLQLNSFSSKAVVTQFVAAFPKIRETSSLIIDLRKNGGGNSGYGWQILTHLSRQPIPTLPWHTLQYRPTMRAWGSQPVTRYAQGSRPFGSIKEEIYDQPVVVLVGAATYSAAEDMAAVFKQLGRGKIIGQATGGSTGQPLSFDLPGGGKARVCTKHDFYPDGTEFVGFGIQPDMIVEPTIADLRSGVDTVVQTAIKELKEASQVR